MMATDEHQKLSAFLKSVHQTLRSQARKVGADKAWQEHCSKSDTLQEYAITMQKLASKFWEQNAADENKNAQSRIKWVVEKCMVYFFQGDMETLKIREEEKLKKMGRATKEGGEECAKSVRVVTNKEIPTEAENLTLLDVGSCYNPFKVYPFLDVVPIDLAPAEPDVYVCDFLNLGVIETEEPMTLIGRAIRVLPSAMFDIVVFSLLLEYLPSSKQRYLCVCKAYQLLKQQGLLFIITPDSKHSSANAPLMKDWRITLAQLGFSRVYYEKLPHIHCMAYRKDINPEIPKHWASYTLSKQNKGGNNADLHITQDFQEILDECDDVPHKQIERSSQDDAMLVQMFSQLPYTE